MSTRPTTVDLADALPRRPVAVRPPQTVAPLALFGLFAMLFGLLGGVLWWLGPDLVRDWRIGDTVPASDVRIEQARCQSSLLVLRTCDLTLADSRDGSKRTLWYAYIDAPGAESLLAVVRPLRGRSDPAPVSTSLGLERLYRRSMTLALIIAILTSCIGAAARVVWQGLRTADAFRGLSGQRMIPVVVQIERHNLVPPRRRLWVYLYNDAGRQGRAFIELPSRDRPLFTDASEKHALALRGEQGGAPLLLDAQLSCLDLTAAEREAFYAACRAAFGDGGASA